MNPATLSGRSVSFLTSESTGIKIPVIYSRGMVFTAWSPSDNDIANMKEGQPVWLIQKGSYIPEMSMIVGHQEFVIPRDMMLEAAENVSPDNQRMIEDATEAKKKILAKREAKKLLVDTLIFTGFCFALLFVMAVAINGWLHLWRNLGR